MKSSNCFWFWVGFFINMLVILVMFIFSGCDSEYVIRMNDILLFIDEHEVCKNKHYVDPYTKREYCLPENFTNMRNIHIYIVEETND